MKNLHQIDEAFPVSVAREQPRRWSRLLTIGALCLGLAACGGGGGGGDAGGTATPSGALRVTVSDAYGSGVAGATVQASVGAAGATGTTDAQGVALLLVSGAVGGASVSVSRDTFVPQTVAATIADGQLTDLKVTLERATSAAGGSLASRGTSPTVTVETARRMTFEIELVIVDGNSQPINDLTSNDFVVRSCTPDPDNDRIDCVRGADVGSDVAYAPTDAGTPGTFLVVPGAPAEPYAAALMLDQSGSVAVSDPTGARLYSAKAFLKGLGAGDHVLLSAFASGNAAKITDKPLTVYPPFRDATTVADTPSYFSALDSLAALAAGDTPLYSALDLLREEIVADASLPPDIAKSVVIFTDGDDTECSAPDACRARRQASIDAANAAGLRIFTIGLTSGVNFEALGELANSTGGAFLFAENAEQLIPLYGSVGRLLSLSLPTYRLSWTVNADADVFVPGNALLGRVQVNTASGTFDVPFIVGIPSGPR